MFRAWDLLRGFCICHFYVLRRILFRVRPKCFMRCDWVLLGCFVVTALVRRVSASLFVCCLYSPFFIADFYDGLSFVCTILRVFLFWQLVSFLWLGNKIRESNENFIILNDIFNNSSNINDRNERSFAQNRTFSIIFALWNISQLI